MKQKKKKKENMQCMIMEKYNKNDDNWVCDYNVYPEQGYYITNKKENEYR